MLSEKNPTHKKSILIVNKLFQDSSIINFFNYAKITHQGQVLDIGMGDIWKDWVKHFNAKYLKYPSITSSRLISGFNYWRNNKNQHLSLTQEDARKNYDLDARVECIQKDPLNDCFHVFSFGARYKNADKAYAFYGLHRGKLLKFISHFHSATKRLIALNDHSDAIIQIPNYKLTDVKDHQKRDYAAELRQESMNLNITTDREFEMMIMFASGQTTVQISQKLNKSLSTVETHLNHIRKKLHLRNRADFRKYLDDQDFSFLERFFFNYFL